MDRELRVEILDRFEWGVCPLMTRAVRIAPNKGIQRGQT